jgi:L-ribulose-5-phosphate 4-epimerase
MGTTHADYFPRAIPNVPVSEFSSLKQYEDQIGDTVSSFLRREDVPARVLGAVLLESHGPIVFSDSISDILEKSIVLEEIAALAYHTLALVPSWTPSAALDQLAKFHYERKHGASRYYGQN